MAERTKHDSMVRMALVPRVLEARDLDVTPGMIKKFRHAGDKNAVNILKYIYDYEIGHVETGGRWFRYLCNQRDLNDEETFISLIKNYMGETIRGPFNQSARIKAGFSQDELAILENL